MNFSVFMYTDTANRLTNTEIRYLVLFQNFGLDFDKIYEFCFFDAKEILILFLIRGGT